MTKISKNMLSAQSASLNTQVEKNIQDLLPVIGSNLDKLLKNQKINAKDLAEITGFSEPAISKYRSGKQLPPLDFLYQLKCLYGISLDDFLFREINRQDIHAQKPLSAVEKAVKSLYAKICGTYLVYFLNSSVYKGRDNNSPDESLVYGVITITEDKSSIQESNYPCIAVLGLRSREQATWLREKFLSLKNYSSIDQFISEDDELPLKTYYGKFDLSEEHAFITLTHDRKDQALIILHRVNSNKKEYIGGMGTINSVSKGREPMPTVQFIALSRYPICLSAEEIHHQLLLSHPTYKSDENVKELISLFKKTYMTPDPEGEIHTELEKELIIKVNLEHYVKKSLTYNMFRYAKISERDDGAWYDLLKKVSIVDT